jgi:hypothetical protein
LVVLDDADPGKKAETAEKFEIPIVTGQFIDACIAKKSIVSLTGKAADTAKYVWKGAEAEEEAEEEIEVKVVTKKKGRAATKKEPAEEDEALPEVSKRTAGKKRAAAEAELEDEAPPGVY